MLYQLNITLTEEDYFAYNYFLSIESSRAKKQLRKTRLKYIGIMTFTIILCFLIAGTSYFSILYSLLIGLYTAIYMLLFKKILKRRMKVQMKNMKKLGKLPFDTLSKIEFYDDLLVEITASTRTEESYNVIERICVVKDKFILLCKNNFSAYILPIAQAKEQLDFNAFFNFLSQKCPNVEYY